MSLIWMSCCVKTRDNSINLHIYFESILLLILLHGIFCVHLQPDGKSLQDSQRCFGWIDLPFQYLLGMDHL